jgi:hypothetical protein
LGHRLVLAKEFDSAPVQPPSVSSLGPSERQGPELWCCTQDAVRELVRSERLSLVFLQENKLDVINDFDDLQIIGSGFNYFYLPAVHTRGGSGV